MENIKKKISILSVLLFCVVNISAQKNATVSEYLQDFKTYPFSDPSPIPSLSPLYPYYRYDGFTDDPEQRKWKIIELQNDFIKVLITPEIGGKIWTAIEKNSGAPFFYSNQVVKFRDIAMRGPWTSGGLEANYGMIGHTPNCATPVDYLVRENEDGSVSCFIGALDLLTRSNWQMEINLPKDKAYFITRSFWHNSSGIEQPYYHWMNLGVKIQGDLEFIFPGNKQIGHEGNVGDWQVHTDKGKQLNFYDQNDFGGYKSYHVLGEYSNFFGVYYHKDHRGMVRFGNYDDKMGRKIWMWGLSDQGMIWENILTDNDGHYAEIQSGRLFNQNMDKSSSTPFKHVTFAPYNTDTWEEYWYPVGNIGGFVTANKAGALNVKYENGWLKLCFSTAGYVEDTFRIESRGTVIYEKTIKMSPLDVFADSVKIVKGDTDSICVTLEKSRIVHWPHRQKEPLNRPAKAPDKFDWDSAYGLYTIGKEYLGAKKFEQAREKFKESLDKDPNYLPSLIKMGMLGYRNMKYPESLAFLQQALSIDAYSGEANYYYGLVNMALGNIHDAKDGFSAATLTSDFRHAAYTELARILAKEKDYAGAIDYAKKALDFNRFNMDAWMLLAVGYRHTGAHDAAVKTLDKIHTKSPLNHFVRFEAFLSDPSEEKRSDFVRLIQNEMPDETFAELAIWYYRTGLVCEARQVFTLSSGQSAETIYWLSFLEGKTVSFDKLIKDQQFPFRSETALVLEELVEAQDDWLLRYHLALIYHDRGRLEECGRLLRSCGDLPDYAPFYATRSLVFEKIDDKLALHDLQKAIAMDPSQWRYQKMITEYYNSRNLYGKGLFVVEPFYEKNRTNYMIGLLYVKTLILNGKLQSADKVLSNLKVLPFEGATEGRDLYRESKLKQAVNLMKQKKYRHALSLIEAARQWPENLGVGKPYEEDTDVRLEDWMQYVCLKKLGNENADWLLKSIQLFQPSMNDTEINFIPSNALISAKAIELLSENQKALEWLNQQEQCFPEIKDTFEWVKDVLAKKPLDRIAFPKKTDTSIGLIIELYKLELM